jgi:hypothetical protein
MAGYTRQSSAQILTGEVVRAAPLNAEFNQVLSAFNSSTGHTHSGATGEGPVIDRIGDTDQYNLVFVNDSLNEIEFFTDVTSASVKQLSIADGVVKPAVTNDLDLGSSSNKFKDLYIAGTAYLTTVDMDGGTIDNAVIGSVTPGVGTFTTVNASSVVSSGGITFGDATVQTSAAEKGDTGTVEAAADGTAALPSISFTSDQDTGLFRDGSGTIKVTSDGTEELTLLRASQVQAEAGTDNSVMMTPLRTAQAIQELSPNNAIPLSFVGFL